MARVERRLTGLGNLWVSGSSFYGISMNACIEKAAHQAEQAISVLRGTAGG
jgi:hypothetical protein